MAARDGAAEARSGPAAKTSGWNWFFDYEPQSVAVLHVRHLVQLFLADAAFAALLALPPIVRATGISSLKAVFLVAVHLVSCVIAGHVVGPFAKRSEVAFHAASMIQLAAGVGISLLFAVFGGDPKTPLWMLPVLYAAMNGSVAESRPSKVVFLTHLLAPLLTIPAFPADSGPWAIGGPVLCAGSSGVTYAFIADRIKAWRGIRKERDEALAALREREAELERGQLARDLHDSVGSALGILSLHATLLERHADEPAEVRRLAALAREVARDGHGELRGVLEAVAPPEATVGALAEALRELAARRFGASDVAVAVKTHGEEALELAPAARLALVRVFQEGLRNAVEHGKARHVEAELRAEMGEVTLALADDGSGFDPARVRPSARGIAGMKARARELGGKVEVETGPRGTRVRFALPLAPGLRSAP